MPQIKKPVPPAKPKAMSATERLIESCVKNARARKKSGETDRQWRQDYAETLKVAKPIPLSETPFDGNTNKKK
jgi:hypothetical protein